MMQRLRSASIRLAFAIIAIGLAPGIAQAQEDDDDDDMTFEEDVSDDAPAGDDEGIIEEGDEGVIEEEGDEGVIEEEGSVDTSGDLDNLLEGGGATPRQGDRKLAENRISWSDIVVVVRKPFLKVSRLELLPTWGVTMNDNIIQHLQLGANLNYYITDVLAVGLEGAYYVDRNREPFDLVARQARRLPTVNKYNYGASLNFHYVPVYGKFAVLDEYLVHWETFFTAGIGFTESETKVRDPEFQPFTNFLITPNVGVSMRFFLTKFMTVNVGIRDYVFVDQFEAVDRTEISGEAAKANADTAIINNVIFQAGISFWIPPTFEYTTFR
jgi:outer membrane beta-barrel protein